MSRIILASGGGGSVESLCFEPVTDYPTAPVGGITCIINLQGHPTDPDGLYIYAYNDSQWKQMETL